MKDNQDKDELNLVALAQQHPDIKALLKKPVVKEQIKKARKLAKESLDKAVAEAKTRFQKP